MLGRALETETETETAKEEKEEKERYPYPAKSKYEDQVTSGILEPLGMTSSGFNWTPDILSRLARGGGNSANHTVTHLGWSAPGGEMFASAADMGRFLNFLTSVEAKGPLGLHWVEWN